MELTKCPSCKREMIGIKIEPVKEGERYCWTCKRIIREEVEK